MTTTTVEGYRENQKGLTLVEKFVQAIDGAHIRIVESHKLAKRHRRTHVTPKEPTQSESRELAKHRGRLQVTSRVNLTRTF